MSESIAGDVANSAHSTDADASRKKQMARAVSTHVSATVGDIVVLMSRSPAHKFFTFADTEWMIAPAVMTGQAFLAEIQNKETGARAPIAVVLWASVSDEIHQKLRDAPKHRIRLRPDEWKSGDHLWIIDAVGEPRALAGALSKLAETQFKDREVSLLVPDNGGVRVAELQELSRKPEPSAAQSV